MGGRHVDGPGARGARAAGGTASGDRPDRPHLEGGALLAVADLAARTDAGDLHLGPGGELALVLGQQHEALLAGFYYQAPGLDAVLHGSRGHHLDLVAGLGAGGRGRPARGRGGDGRGGGPARGRARLLVRVGAGAEQEGEGNEEAAGEGEGLLHHAAWTLPSGRRFPSTTTLQLSSRPARREVQPAR